MANCNLALTHLGFTYINSFNPDRNLWQMYHHYTILDFRKLRLDNTTWLGCPNSCCQQELEVVFGKIWTPTSTLNCYICFPFLLGIDWSPSYPSKLKRQGKKNILSVFPTHWKPHEFRVLRTFFKEGNVLYRLGVYQKMF